jgi:ATP-dependent Clp protease ATP-binding subunit ClpC
MPAPSVPSHWIFHSLEPSAEGDPQVLTQLLMWPELSAVANKEVTAQAAVVTLVEETLRKQPLDELSRRSIDSEPYLTQVKLKAAPAKVSEAWSEPLEVELEAVCWHNGQHLAALVPALGITVLAEDEEQLQEILPHHIDAALKRDGLNQSLLHIARLQRGTTTLRQGVLQTGLESASQRWARLQRQDESADPIADLTSKMEGDSLPRAWSMRDPLALLSRLLTLPNKPSVLLVGPGGVGKTALVQELARQRSEWRLASKRFLRTSGARLVAGACGFGMWQMRCWNLIVALSHGSSVLCVGNLFELLNVGQSSTSSESIASFLRPYLVRGELQIIAECTPEQLAVLEKNDARLADAFRILRVDEPTEQRCADILQSVSVELGGGKKGRFEKSALQRVQKLFSRYLGTYAMPGAAIRFMQRAHETLGKDAAVADQDIYALFSAETGMPLALLDPEKPLDLKQTEHWFSHRVRGQPKAVEAIVSTLAQTKAGLGRPHRPLASLLFTGPTGTGKTEMAKALAEFLFQSPERLVRLDMSEYSQPWSAQRLVSGQNDGKEGILTAALREQPFCVLLLDEFEKADPSVFDLLLQVLGEARLTDAAGRTADFSNCVIIMTSNLGAASFGKSTPGFNHAAQQTDQTIEHFTSAVQQVLRPEMFNRIDRIVPYLPLTPEVVLELTQRELRSAAERTGFSSRNVQLIVNDEAQKTLAEQGYDPRYGARPLKRRVADLVLAPVATLLSESSPHRAIITAAVESAGEIALKLVHSHVDPHHQETMLNLTSRLEQASQLRRRYERLRNSTMALALGSKYRLLGKKTKKQRQRAKRDGAEAAETFYPEAKALKTWLDRLEQEAQEQRATEEALLLAYNRENTTEPQPNSTLSNQTLELTALDGLLLWQTPPKQLVLMIQGAPSTHMMRFARFYRDLAVELGGQVSCGVFRKGKDGAHFSKDGLWASPEVLKQPADLDTMALTDTGKVAAVVLWVTGARANLLLQPESGIHRCRAVQKTSSDEAQGSKRVPQKKSSSFLWQCRLDVHVPEGEVRDLSSFVTPASIVEGLPDLESATQRRLFDPEKSQVREGAEQTRSAGEFTLPWLKERLLANAVKEAGL